MTRGHAATIAIADAGSDRHWTAGGSVCRTMVRAMVEAGALRDRELVFVTSSARDEDTAFAEAGVDVVSLAGADATSHRRIGSSSTPFERKIRRALAIPDAADALAYLRRRAPDAVLPMLSVPPRPRLRGVIGWLPDFQHIAMPQYFSDSERRYRTRLARALSARADLVLLSSNAMAKEFAQTFHDHKDKARVLSFPSTIGFADLSADPHAVAAAYHLPEKFALVANQFWQHKNHELVVDAVRRARDLGVAVPIVMTGLPSDHRDPGNATVSRVLQQIAKADLTSQIVVLGQVPYLDLVDLVRACAFVVQPSRYEGWNTAIEDAKAVGRTVVCSDIPVHREQTVGFSALHFDLSAHDLSVALADAWRSASVRNATAEQVALNAARERVVRYGEGLLAIADEASAIA